MKAPLVWTASLVVLMLSSPAALAQNKAACARVQFSDELLERFPNAPGACLDVINRGGQEYAVFRAQFQRASGNNLFVRFVQPDGSRGPLTRVPTEPSFRVLVDGEETRVDQLARNQELTAYVQVSTPTPMIAVAPAREETRLRVVPFVVVPAAEEQVAMAETDQTARADQGGPSMPSTARAAPAFGALGLVLIGTAILLVIVRRMLTTHSNE